MMFHHNLVSQEQQAIWAASFPYGVCSCVIGFLILFAQYRLYITLLKGLQSKFNCWLIKIHAQHWKLTLKCAKQIMTQNNNWKLEASKMVNLGQ